MSILKGANMKPADYWRKHPGAMRNMNPVVNPEGFNRYDWLEEQLYKAGILVPQMERNTLLDFGCGDGEFYFQSPHCEGERRPFFINYYGIDINERALDIAREREHGRKPAFFNVESYDSISRVIIEYHIDITIAWAVLLHIDDESILQTIRALCHSPTVIVAEILGREWRRPGNPPVFNRNLIDYEELFAECGKQCVWRAHRPYAHYQNKAIAKGKNTDINMLIFQ